MTVYSRCLGEGPDLVLLHGWGLNGGIWGGVVERLAESFRVTVIDLPGHGRSKPLQGPYSASTLARAVVEAAPQRAHWLGWSLGGAIAATVALEMPERVDKLVLAATNLRFVKAGDWPGMAPDVLESFTGELERDYHATLMRFLSLQVKGAERAKETIRRLRAALAQGGEPQPEALRGGLQVLRETDLRAQMAKYHGQTLWLFGRLDALVPRRVASEVSNTMPSARVHVVDGAGHAPFISHGEDFIETVSSFLLDE